MQKPCDREVGHYYQRAMASGRRAGREWRVLVSNGGISGRNGSPVWSSSLSLASFSIASCFSFLSFSTINAWQRS